MPRYYFLFIFLITLGCGENQDSDPDPNPVKEELYFPPADNSTWEKTSPESLDWDTSGLEELFSFLQENNTRAFLILVNGRIVIERYWGNNIQDSAPFDKESRWYWASAGKSLTATLTGIAQEEGLLRISDKTSDYLGSGWSSLSPEKEDLITIKNQLTMTTGLDYEVDDVDCTDPDCLQYKADAGTQWYYHNAPYTLISKVIENAAGVSYNAYTDEKIEAIIGMNGFWLQNDFNNVYWSTPRDAARFGLLIQNEGVWDEAIVLSDKDYFDSMTNTSQEMNPSYGYLWWLNGKDSMILPGFADAFNASISPMAPSDLIGAMGKNGQFINVIPSLDMIVVRMGEAPDDSLVPVIFHNNMWGKLMEAIN